MNDLESLSEQEKTPCMKCSRPVDGYLEKRCCNGQECGCMGLPLEPCLCDECWKLYDQEKENKALREYLGQLVRDEWIAWAKTQPNPKPSWLVEWNWLSEPDKEVDRRIGERLFRAGIKATISARSQSVGAKMLEGNNPK